MAHSPPRPSFWPWGSTSVAPQLVWDSVALHATASISLSKEREVALCARGVALDFGGPDYGAVAAQIETVVQAIPRLDFKRQFSLCICHLAATAPQVTYDTFIRDFGLRFVPDYRPPNAVDLIMGGPFED